VDWLYLKVSQRDLKKIINQPRGAWKEMVEDQMYIQATPYLVEKLERQFEAAAALAARPRYYGVPAASGAVQDKQAKQSKQANQTEQTEKFDVALSFAGEQRPYVERVARVLKSRGVRYYYDDDERVTMWGKDLSEHLADVFENRADYVVMFISKEYAEKMWPIHERRSAQARAIKERREYMLPARFDDTELPGLRHTVSYINLNDIEPEKFAEMILKKIGRAD
jgi:hypothetical protein